MYPFLKPGDRLVVEQAPLDSLEVGDVVVRRNAEGLLVAHRLVKILLFGRGITKGDSLLAPDPEQFDLAGFEGLVVAVLRGRRLIRISAGPRSWFKGLYAKLSLKALTCGAVRLRIKNILNREYSEKKSDGPAVEDRFIVGVLGGEIPKTKANLNWDAFVEKAWNQGVAGILYMGLKGKDIPPAVICRLKDYYYAAVHLNFVHLQTLEVLEDLLSQNRIELMALKGAALIEKTYPSLGARPMEDLDLMVRDKDQVRFTDLLYNLGYVNYLGRPHLFIKKKSIIDLHMHALNTDRIASRSGLFPAGMAPVWEKSVPWKEGFKWLRRPDDADNVLLLCQHFMKHSFSRLIWLVDIHELLKQQEKTFWIRLAERAAFLDQKKALAYVLYLLDKLLNFQPPDNCLPVGFSKDISGFEKTILDMKISGRPLEQTGPLLSLFSLAGFRRKIAFLLENIFPANKVVKQEFGEIFTGRRIFIYPIRLWQTVFFFFRQLSQIFDIIFKI